MIREIFNQIRNEYKLKSQHIESIKRQIDENPDKFKKMVVEQDDTAQKQKQEEQKQKQKEEENKVKAEDAEAAEDDEAKSQKSKVSEKVPQKRAAIDKQTAYIEFKNGVGKKIEDNILLSRKDMK